MLIVAIVLTLLAAVLHIAIFVMESIAWTKPAVWKRFGVSDQESAEITRPLAYNQGFYNLFLAISAIIGAVLMALGQNATNPGVAVVIMATGSMFLASIVLLTSGKNYLRPALTQGTLPLLGLIFTILAAR